MSIWSNPPGMTGKGTQGLYMYEKEPKGKTHDDKLII